MENNENKSFENEEELQTNSIDETVDVVDEATVGLDNELGEEVEFEPEVMAKPKKNKNTGIIVTISIVGALLIAAIATLCYNFFLKTPTDGSAVIMSIDDQKMIEKDFRYFMAGEAYNVQVSYIYEEMGKLGANATEEDQEKIINKFDWNATNEGIGKTYADIARENAVSAARDQFVGLFKAKKLGVTLTDDEKAFVTNYIESAKEESGEKYEESLAAIGLESHEHFLKTFENIYLVNKLSEMAITDPKSVGIEDISVLEDYVDEDVVTVKHILLMTTDEETGAPISDEQKAEVRKQAEEILARAKNGENFDALVSEFNQDPGATELGYTFGPGEMVPEFEAASFALKFDEISDIVETDYGFHIIKRTPGFNEILNMWTEEVNVKVNEPILNKIEVQKEEENAFKTSEEE